MFDDFLQYILSWRFGSLLNNQLVLFACSLIFLNILLYHTLSHDFVLIPDVFRPVTFIKSGLKVTQTIVPAYIWWNLITPDDYPTDFNVWQMKKIIPKIADN